ncbi:putative metal-dependent hydrolase [Echinicola sp. CAU 1574]|uniref:Metal-dependent hydrolase n=1 Tax=Echinicola arenosa TaxID=2774144 RepID=A0ABR9AK76_9BACT|nr:putative metal-dependent hydrolase [Echinicola arenosa]MBD8488747.1 putative metal-dependent hydrolase [Echinicola arenosa]
MTTEELEKLKYPIGRFYEPKNIDDQLIQTWIEDISSFPIRIKDLTEKLGMKELNWKYRPEGWSIKQVVHHCGDSHLNSIIRFKLALTEDTPSIKPYHETKWAELADSLEDDITYSLKLLEGLHHRWVKLLKSLTKEQLERTFYHPQQRREINLAETIGIYAWHCNHHLAHVRQALDAKGGFN